MLVDILNNVSSYDCVVILKNRFKSKTVANNCKHHKTLYTVLIISFIWFQINMIKIMEEMGKWFLAMYDEYVFVCLFINPRCFPTEMFDVYRRNYSEDKKIKISEILSEVLKKNYKNECLVLFFFFLVLMNLQSKWLNRFIWSITFLVLISSHIFSPLLIHTNTVCITSVKFTMELQKKHITTSY